MVSKTKPKKINGYFAPKNKRQFSEVVSKMVAKAVFHVFEHSEELLEFLKARGYDIPSTAKTFKKMVINFSKEVRQNQKTAIKEMVSKGERFCITFDECL